MIPKSGLLFAPHDSQRRLTPFNRLLVDTDDVSYFVFIFTEMLLRSRISSLLKVIWPTEMTLTNQIGQPNSSPQVWPLYYTF